MHPELRVLQEATAARAADITAARPWWPCRKGCDLCCRSLAAVPRLGAPEWELLREGLSRLAPAVLEQIRSRVAELAAANRPVICPFLDRESHACWIYAQRPLACRAYGFYVEREGGLYCREIEALMGRGECRDVIWGNAAALASRLARLGEEIDLRIWFQAAP